MRLFRNTFHRNGAVYTSPCWTVEFRDHGNHGPRKTRRIVTVENRKAAEAMGRRLQQLADQRMADLPPDAPTVKWLSRLPDNIIRRLVEWDLIDRSHVERLTPVRDHLEAWREWMAGRGHTAKHIRLVRSRITEILDQTGAISIGDLKPLAVGRVLTAFRASGLSPRTVGHYSQAVTTFTKWMIRHGLATTDPLAALERVQDRTDVRCRRRALSVKQLQRLLRVTRKGPIVSGLTGTSRALLYRFAVETGLRAAEIRALTIASFDLDAGTLTLRATETKRRRETVMPLATATVDWLRPVLVNRPPQQRAFRVPNKPAEMLRFDLERAGIPYVDAQGRRFDFHALRGQLATLLAQAGVHPSIAKKAMRHSNIALTMDTYTHTEADAVRDALAALPDLAW
jgi:integrase